MNTTTRPGSAAAPITVLLTVLATDIVAAAIGIVGGTALALHDLADTTDDWHGIGVFVGLLTVAPSALVGGLSVVLTVAVRRGRRQGDRDRVRASAMTVLVVTLLGLAVLVSTVRHVEVLTGFAVLVGLNLWASIRVIRMPLRPARWGIMDPEGP